MPEKDPQFRPPDVAIFVLVTLITCNCLLLVCVFWFSANFIWYCVTTKVEWNVLILVVTLAITIAYQLLRYLSILVEALLLQVVARWFSKENVDTLERTIKMPLLKRDESTKRTSDFLIEVFRELVNRLTLKK